MKRITLLLLLVTSILSVKAQIFRTPTVDSAAIGKVDGTTGTAIYGDVYLKNVIPGLMGLNASKQLTNVTLTSSDIPSLPISKITGLQDSLTNKYSKSDANARFVTPTSTNTFTNKTWNGVAIGDAYISSASTWNAKESALTFSSPLVRSTNTISIPLATSSVNGYLSSADRVNFQTAYTYSQVGHLPLSAGASYPLTGTLYGGGGLGLYLNGGSGVSKTSYILYTGTNASSTAAAWYTGLNPFATDGSYEIKNGAGSIGFTMTTSGATSFTGTGSFGGLVTVPSLKITTGANNGYFLKSDASGNATWQSQASGTTYKGSWNASTNTPTLADGTGTTGDMYAVSVGGSQFSRTFVAGGWAIYNGSIWEAVGTSASVTSVNALTGSVQVNPSISGNILSVTGGTATADLGAISTSGNAGTATALQTARTINGTSFNGTANITVTAAAGTLTGSTLASGVTASSLTSVGTLTNLTVTNPIAGSVTGSAGVGTTATISNDNSSAITVYPVWAAAASGNQALTASNTKLAFSPSTGVLSAVGFAGPLSGNASTATALVTPRTIAGVSFDGTANISLNNNAITNGAGYITQTAADAKVQNNLTASTTIAPSATAVNTALALKANLASPTFTGTVAGITASMVGAPSGSGTSTGTNTGDQDLSTLAPKASPTFTGIVSGITKSMVGLSSVDNTSDAGKPVSTAQQTALDLKADISSLASVATSGDYNDLSNKPAIPVSTSGTWTPATIGGSHPALSASVGTWVRNGNQVFAYFKLTFPVSASSLNIEITDLPFSAKNDMGVVSTSFNQAGVAVNGETSTGLPNFFIRNAATGVQLTYSGVSAQAINGVVIYELQ